MVEKMDLFLLGKKVIDKLTEAGYEAYFVGGAVRDHIIEREINDVDIATNALPEQVMLLFPKTVPTGLKHGTVTVIIESVSFEVTTYRKEGKYTDYRHPEEVAFVSSLDEDLSRRDFTMNAIAMDEKMKFVDPLDGQAAIKKREIVAVGDPKERFLEDPLRSLRGIRFASQLQFRIEEKTWEALKFTIPYLKYIAPERIKAELDKLISSVAPEVGIRLIRESRLFLHIKGLDQNIFCENDLADIEELLKLSNDLNLRWAILLRPLTEQKRTHFYSRLHFSKLEMKEIESILSVYHRLTDSVAEGVIKQCLVETSLSITLKGLKLLSLINKLNINFIFFH